MSMAGFDGIALDLKPTYVVDGDQHVIVIRPRYSIAHGREPKPFWSTLEGLEAEYDKRFPAENPK